MIPKLLCFLHGHTYRKLRTYWDFRNSNEAFHASNGVHFDMVQWEKKRCTRCGKIKHTMKEE